MMLSPPSAKKLSSMPDPIEPQHLGEQAAQDLLRRRARRAHRRGREVRRRQRPPVELAVRRQRQPIQQHECRRHHVVGQARGNMRPQRSLHRRSHPRLPPRRRPAAWCRAHPRAQSPPPAPRRHAAPAPPRSRPARCGSRGSSPARRRARGSPAPRPRASAPDRRCGTCGCRQAQTDRPRTAPPSAPHAPDSRAPDPPPRRKARPRRRPERAADKNPKRKRACWQIGRPIGTLRPRRSARRPQTSRRPSFRWGRRRLIMRTASNAAVRRPCRREHASPPTIRVLTRHRPGSVGRAATAEESRGVTSAAAGPGAASASQLQARLTASAEDHAPMPTRLRAPA